MVTSNAKTFLVCLDAALVLKEEHPELEEELPVLEEEHQELAA